MACALTIFTSFAQFWVVGMKIIALRFGGCRICFSFPYAHHGEVIRHITKGDWLNLAFR